MLHVLRTLLEFRNSYAINQYINALQLSIDNKSVHHCCSWSARVVWYPPHPTNLFLCEDGKGVPWVDPLSEEGTLDAVAPYGGGPRASRGVVRGFR